uniref:bifunctional DNA primase/polymerase n=1 Tax=Paractinoplanes polyasparticus TaxID=2856853 RepID=UPI001C846972|nr:bifunctional DNA primase/polymerase [Actinoplanes polyasparticus]
MTITPTHVDVVRDAALAWHDAGFCVLPAAGDGTKRPLGDWKRYQREQFPREALASGQHHGIGLVCGAVSGGLEMLEAEGRAMQEGALQKVAAAAAERGLDELWRRITVDPGAYVEMTPSGGVHILYRITGGPVPGNTKLASRPARTDELTGNEPDLVAKGRTVIRVLAETRGEGGYVVVAPSGGPTHPTGQPWRLAIGAPGVVPTVTTAEQRQLHDLVRVLDQLPPPAKQTAVTAPQPRAATIGGQLSPGDDFAAHTSWAEILEPEGWQERHQEDGVTYWTRPGKDMRDGHSATTNHGGTDRLKVLTSSTEFQSVLDTGETYSKFGAWALLNHGGDHSAAARDLAARGYGTPPPGSAWPLATPPPAWFTEPVEPATGQPPAVIAPRPSLDVGNPAVMFEWLRVNLGRGLLAGMFLRGADLVHTPREGEEGYVPLRGAVEDGDDGPAQVQRAHSEYVAARVQIAFDCVKEASSGSGKDKVKFYIPAMFPAASAKRVSAVLDELPQLRRLRGVIHTPAFRPDGSLIRTPGYDPVTRLLYLPDPKLTIPAVPEHPTPEQIQAAVARIDLLLSGFPFTSASSRANYIGALITPLLRAIVPPPYKLIAIGAHQRGSGKTKLANVARIVHGGVFRAEFPDDEAELGKQITAILEMTTGPVVVIDNVSGVLRSSKFAGLLTNDSWGDRLLGGNEWIGVPNDRLWVVTGNNLSLGGDIPRRTITVTIDPGVPRPELRTGFAIGDPEVWATAHRADLLHALLTIVQAWVVAGMRRGSERSSDGYARWTQTVEGIITTAGIEGGFDHDSTQIVVGSDDDDWEHFLTAVHKVRGNQVWTVKEVLADVDPGHNVYAGAGIAHKPIPLDALPTELADKAARSPQGIGGIAKTLGRWLMNRDGRWAGSLAVRAAGSNRDKVRLWRIESAAGLAGFAGSDSLTYAREVESPVSENPVWGPPDQTPQTPLTPQRAQQSPRPEAPALPMPPAPGPNYCPRCSQTFADATWVPCDRCGTRHHARGRGGHGPTCQPCQTGRTATP